MRDNRFVVLGAGGVGKTSLVMQYLDRYFPNAYKPTVEDCYQHTVQLPDGISHTFEILDTAGSHNFPAMRELGIRSGRGFLLVFSVDSLQSFRESVELGEHICEIRGSQVPVILVGNKSDLESHRQVSQQMAAEAALEKLHDCTYIEASAKFNVNVQEIFLKLLQLARTLEEAQEALEEEEQEMEKKKKRKLSKRMLRDRYHCIVNFDPKEDRHEPVQRQPSNRLEENQKCVLI